MQLFEGKYKTEELEFEGRQGIIVFPSDKTKNTHFLIKTEYFGEFTNLECAMLDEGYHLIFLRNKHRWGSYDDIDAKARFIKFVSGKYKLSKKCVPVGMSCGGMFAVKLAAKYPELISAMYLDAPVINLLSCPFNFGNTHKYDEGMINEALSALGLTISDMLVYRDSPYDHLSELIAHKIPVIMLYGDLDDVVPYEENGIHLERIYHKNNIPITVIKKEGVGHHPHSLLDPSPIKDFILKYDNQ